MKLSLTKALTVLMLLLLAWLSASARAQRFSTQSAEATADSAKPSPAPSRWRPLIGEYVLESETVIILENQGTLSALFKRTELDPLQEVSKDTFQFSPASTRASERVVFSRDSRGKVTQVEIGKLAFKRKLLGPEEGSNQLRVEPLRPVPILIKEARTAHAPAEPGDFLAPDLVELKKLDPTIKLEIRYATTNNLFGTVFYSQPRAFMQRPAAEALVRINRKLKASGYGLLVHDAYRPWYVTKVFWDATPDDKKMFVADPSKGSRHNRGCAVDLTLYDLKTGKPIEMVSTYDETTDRAHPDYPGGTSLQRWHRNLLRSAMEADGFTVFEGEWWHFDYKDWQKYAIGNQRFELIRDGKPSDPFVEWPTGQPLPMDISWYHFTAGHVLQNMEAVDWKKLYWHLPHLTMDEAIGRPNPLWKEEVEHSKLDSWWEPQRYQNKYEQVRVPALGISGWYDDEQVGTPLNDKSTQSKSQTLVFLLTLQGPGKKYLLHVNSPYNC